MKHSISISHGHITETEHGWYGRESSYQVVSEVEVLEVMIRDLRHMPEWWQSDEPGARSSARLTKVESALRAASQILCLTYQTDIDLYWLYQTDKIVNIIVFNYHIKQITCS